jgi:hypothetical protein
MLVAGVVAHILAAMDPEELAEAEAAAQVADSPGTQIVEAAAEGEATMEVKIQEVMGDPEWLLLDTQMELLLLVLRDLHTILVQRFLGTDI